MISYQKSCDGLYLIVDSTGLKFLGEGEWKRKKHQPEYRRQWRKLHIGIDAKTLQIRAVQLTTNNVSDSQVLGDLLDQIPQDERVDSVYTDGAYDTKQCRQVIADRQAHAVIPPRKNAKPWKDKKMGSLERNELLRTVKRLGRTIWKKWSGYHRRSSMRLPLVTVDAEQHIQQRTGQRQQGNQSTHSVADRGSRL